MAVGSGLGVHVRDGYKFLMQNYQEGDRICLFGFSRGAYTARCLAGMIHKVGLLPAHNVAQIPFAYQFYKDDTEEGTKAVNPSMSQEHPLTFTDRLEDEYRIQAYILYERVGPSMRTHPLRNLRDNMLILVIDLCRSVYFIGVFDSVSSVGFIPRTLPLSSTPTNKSHYFRHAIALDEHRAKFKACRFQRKDAIGSTLR